MTPYRSLLAVAVATALAGVAGAGTPEVPAAPAGKRAAATAAVLAHQHGLCGKLATRLGERWRQAGVGGGAEARMRDWVLEAALGELAAARAAGDLAARLLEGARGEAGAELATVLARRRDATRELCDAVALPAGPRDAWAARVAAIEERLAVDVAALGRLLVVPPGEADALLEPYLVPIQLAAVEAEGEYHDYLESLRPKAPPPSPLEPMRAWHAGYAAAVAPVKEALRAYLEGRTAADAGRIRDACRTLATTLAPLLRDPAVFRAPDTAAGPPLLAAYRALRDLANACNAARFPAADDALRTTQDQLAAAARVLARYGLAP